MTAFKPTVTSTRPLPRFSARESKESWKAGVGARHVAHLAPGLRPWILGKSRLHFVPYVVEMLLLESDPEAWLKALVAPPWPRIPGNGIVRLQHQLVPTGDLSDVV